MTDPDADLDAMLERAHTVLGEAVEAAVTPDPPEEPPE